MPLNFFSIDIVLCAPTGDALAITVRNMVKANNCSGNSRKPLSDKMICKMITDEGLNLAGLIADKYREW